MAAQPSLKLFDLIQSLSMSEKRFFKVFSGRHVIEDKNNYTALFDLIESMSSYDDQVVRDAPFVKNSSAEKNYLYRSILKSLNVYHAQSTARLKIFDLLTSAEVLKAKGLYQQSLTLVLKAKGVAEQAELFREQLTVQEMQSELLLKNLDYEATLEVLNGEEELMRKLENLRAMTSLTTQAYAENLTKGVVRTKADLDPLERMTQTPLLKDKGQAHSRRARLHQISLALTYHMVAGNGEALIEETGRIIEHYEAHDHLIAYTPIGYVSAIFIYGSAQRDLGRYEDGLVTVAKLGEVVGREAVSKSQKAVASAFFYRYILGLQLHGKVGDNKAAAVLVQESEKNVSSYQSFIGKPQLYDLLFQYAKFYFRERNFKSALSYTNDILNDHQFKVREDFGIAVRLFNLVVHYELGNDFTLDYLSRSTYQYLRKRNKLFKVEKLLVRFLERHPSRFDQEKTQPALQKLIPALQACKEDEKESRALRYFDFVSWAESKQVSS